MSFEKIDKNNIPHHVAVIMDGNGRWAKKRGMKREYGHRAGRKSVKKIIESCLELGIKNLTLYAFSTENWNRPKIEIDFLTQLLFLLTLTLALSYGSRNEIVNVVREVSDKVKNNIISSKNIDETVINDHLYTRNLPDVDLLIRTSGEKRISNFLLWQIAYSELYFTKKLWPDFRKKDLYKAIVSYQNRERRFGKTSEQIK